MTGWNPRELWEAAKDGFIGAVTLRCLRDTRNGFVPPRPMPPNYACKNCGERVEQAATYPDDIWFICKPCRTCSPVDFAAREKADSGQQGRMPAAGASNSDEQTGQTVPADVQGERE